MQELKDLVWTEKYRCSSLEDLILNDKHLIINYLKNPKSIPSFIFYSNSPGTGKTTLAKIIIKELGCDYIMLNASDERGVDTVREKINFFAKSMSSNKSVKRCIFLDEGDFLTSTAQSSLKNSMEEYSENAFFIWSGNNLEKIIEPIRSRCQLINFANPDKKGIENRLEYICQKEEVDCDIKGLVETYYPDIRRMILTLQESKISGIPWSKSIDEFENFYKLMKLKDIKSIQEKVFGGEFPVQEFNNWFFQKLFKEQHNHKNLAEISILLADTEKNWTLQANINIVFLSNIIQILKLL